MKEKLKTLVLAFSGVIVYSALLTAIPIFIDTNEYALLTAKLVTILLGSVYTMTVLNDKSKWRETPKPKFLAATAVLVVFFAFTATLVVNAVSGYMLTGQGVNTGSESAHPVLLAIISIFITPIAEEIVYRRFLYGVLAPSNEVRALIISTAVFALSHGALLHVAAAFFGGLIFCRIYRKTGKLRYSIAAHILYNFTAYFIVYIPYPDFIFDIRVTIILICAFLAYMLAWFQMKAMDDGKIEENHNLKTS